MTQKRFIFDGLHVRDTLNEIPPIMAHNDEQRDKFLDGLNKLSEENKELQDFKDLWIGQNSILERENKALKECNQELTRQLSVIKIEKINEIIEQNKKLKKQINELMK